jgi:hypothetical protein
VLNANHSLHGLSWLRSMGGTFGGFADPAVGL